MKTINLRWIYPHYRHDEFVEVSDEVWEAMRQAKREMNNYERRKVYHHAWYSLDAYSWTENYALEHGRSPEEILLEREERAARLRLVAALPEALAHATPTQAAVSGPTISPVSTSRKLPGWRACTAARSALPSGGACGICAAAMTAFSRQNEGGPMQTINLKQYYPFCTEDTFVEVSDEIVEAFLLDKRAEAARERKMYRYKAFYSLDCDDGIENAAIGWAQPSPEDYLMEKEAQAEYAELLRRLYEALSSLPPTQARRVHARYMLGMKVKDIAAMEGITPSQAGKSIHAALGGCAGTSYTGNGQAAYENHQPEKILLPDL